MPGITRKSLFSDISISDVTIFNVGNFLQTACMPSGACIVKFEVEKKGEILLLLPINCETSKCLLL